MRSFLVKGNFILKLIAASALFCSLVFSNVALAQDRQINSGVELTKKPVQLAYYRYHDRYYHPYHGHRYYRYYGPHRYYYRHPYRYHHHYYYR